MFGFIIALAAGFLTPHAEEPVARPLIKALGPVLKIEEGEHRLVAFLVVAFGATIVVDWLDTGSPFWIIAGLTLGYFATRLVAAAKAALDGRKAD